jgi:putative transposase
VLTGAVAEEIGLMLDAICAERGWPVISREIQPDHIHLFVSIPPAIAVADAVKVLKGITARRLFQRFPQLKDRLWNGHLWSPSYYAGTAGNVSAETIRRYIERSEHVTKRR